MIKIKRVIIVCLWDCFEDMHKLFGWCQALSQLTAWRHSAIWSFWSVPFSHSLLSHAGTCKSVLFRFSATILLILALAAFRSFSLVSCKWC